MLITAHTGARIYSIDPVFAKISPKIRAPIFAKF
jgi:hypothetical protein